MAARRLLLFAVAVIFAVLAPRQTLAGAQQYTNPNFAELAKSHKTIAVLPFKVTIDKKKLPKNVTLEMVEASEREESTEFQHQLYARFLQRAQAGEYSVGFQDVDQTTTLLTRAGITVDSLALHTKDELAKLLSVDAVVSGSIHQAQPTSTGVAMAQTLIFGFSGSTQRVDINMNLHNGADGALLWSYDHTDKGGMANSVEAMTKSLLKKVAGNFPYRISR